MTARVLFRCDGAVVPRPLRQEGWTEERDLCSDGPDPNLSIGGIYEVRDVLQRLSGRAADLVRIAAFAYIADRSVSRGSELDVFGRRWRRTLALCIPVSEPAFWSRDDVRTSLSRLLFRATEDQWRFAFSSGMVATGQFSLVSDTSTRAAVAGSPDCVVLFSGGADSLCATVEAAKKGARPLLVSHSPSPRHDGRQQLLIDELREHLAGWNFPRLRFPIHLVGSKAPDSTQRSRPFLFGSLGAAVAHQLGGLDVILADNGFISLNPPLNGAVRGAYASRSTHPKVIALLNELIRLIFRSRIEVKNPLEWRTRTEVLQVLKRSKCPDLLPLTNSCSRTWGLPNATPHCGYCSQCVDRRFGIIGAGLEYFEPPNRYKLDIFTQELAEGEPRTVALSYVNLARDLRSWTDQQMFDELPELGAALPADPATSDRMAGGYIAMLRRHGDDVRRVMVKMQRQYAEDIFDRRIAENSLLRLDSGGQVVEIRPLVEEVAEPLRESTVANVFCRRGGGWEVAYGGRSTVVGHRLGFIYIARLLEYRHQGFDPLELRSQERAAVPDPTINGAMAPEKEPVNELGRNNGRPGRQQVADQQTREEYEARAKVLAAKRAAAEDAGDVRASEEVEAEIDELTRQWQGVFGLGSRSREFPDGGGQVANTVAKAIRGAIEYLRGHHPSLAAHLDLSIDTGSVCRYAPEQSIDWTVSF